MAEVVFFEPPLQGLGRSFMTSSAASSAVPPKSAKDAGFYSLVKDLVSYQGESRKGRHAATRVNACNGDVTTTENSQAWFPASDQPGTTHLGRAY